MFSKLIGIFRIPELRQKILLTLVLLAVYRMGFAIPLPFVDQQQFGGLNQCAGNADPLSLTTRKLVGAFVGHMHEPDTVE